MNSLHSKKTPLLAIGIILLLIIVAGFVYFFAASKAHAPTTSNVASSTAASSTSPVSENQNDVTYFCTEGTLKVDYLDSTLATSKISLTLPNGTSLTLPQVQSGSGIRYETGAGTASDIEFDSEGTNAFLTQDGTTTFNNCLAGTSSSLGSNLYKFTSQGNTFSFTYPAALLISGDGIGYSSDWMVGTTTLGMVLAKATLPSSFEPKTNFVNAVLTIGTSADPTAISGCLTNSGADVTSKGTSTTINGVTYERFISTGVGAGNSYQTTSYRTLKDNQCYAIEYTIHSANIENYSPDQGISTFNQAQIQSTLDGIIQSFTFL